MYEWKTKRDFLLLARAVKQVYQHEMTVKVRGDSVFGTKSLMCFPKSAFQKIVENYPWTRPNVDLKDIDGSSNNDDRFIGCQMDTSSSSCDNCFHPRMKKSLMQMDQFLLQVYKLATSFNDFAVVQDGDANASRDILVRLSRAWREFCRCDNHDQTCLYTSSNKFMNESPMKSNDMKNKPLSSQENLKIRTGVSLGQYFANDDNVVYTVENLLKYLLSRSKLSPSSPNRCKTIQSIVKDYIFVEPSCGDGRILSEIMRRLTTLQDVDANPNTFAKPSIIGYDIDPVACNACRRRLSDRNYSIPVICTDFLQITRQEFRSHCCDMMGMTDRSVLHKKVVMVGGPPYTVGRGKDIERDLPMKFIVHSFLELGAEHVCFILPERCGKEAFVYEIKNCFDVKKYSAHHISSGKICSAPNKTRKISQETKMHKVGETSVKFKCISSYDLPSSKFFFCGERSHIVDQPSILQIYSI